MNGITEAAIRQHSDSRSYSRGEEYYRGEAVISVSRRGDLLYAVVEGSGPDPYEVTVTLGPNGPVEAECDCPYEGDGWCKHIVAALLCCLNEPEDVEERPTLESLLASLDRDALQTLLLNLARRMPELAEAIELGIALLKPQVAERSPVQNAGLLSAPPLLVPADLSAMRRQIRVLLKSAGSMQDYDSWDDDGYSQLADLEAGITPLIETADAFTNNGDVRTALMILEAISDELLTNWHRVEDVVGEAEEFFSELGRSWAEAILTGELSSEERQGWIARLTKWQRKGESSGAYSGLAVAVEAARHGWDYPPLVRVLQGEVTDKGAWEGDAPDCADELAVARLNVLERQGRLQEAVYLAKAESQYDRYMALLVRLGRAKEAVDFGMEVLTSADTALGLAITLHECGETALAVRIAEHGLGLTEPRYALAIWMRNTALTMGDTERAIQGAKAAIEELPHLSDYTHLQEVAGDRWPQIRDEILSGLRQSNRHSASGKVDIFLLEGLMQDALNAIRDSYDYSLIARVVEAATPALPLQVIPICIGQAATIMDAGKADRYHHASRWVERARDAYRSAGQETNWQSFKAALLETHKRKYKLIPMLRDL